MADRIPTPQNYVVRYPDAGTKYVWHTSMCLLDADPDNEFEVERALYWNGTEWEPAYSLEIGQFAAVHVMRSEQAFRMVGEELARWLVKQDGTGA